MRTIPFPLVGVLLAGLFGLAARPALAQNAPSPSGSLQAPQLQPKTDTDQTLPPALPGAGDQSLATAPSVAKQQSGDPTPELFTAINANDYGAAQDAISRGADLNAENALGETPIDLSVSLNHNSITFMLLAARNDSGDDGDDAAGSGPAPAAAYAAKDAGKTAAVPVKLIATPSSAPGNNPGVPNASAGFLGFNK